MTYTSTYRKGPKFGRLSFEYRAVLGTEISAEFLDSRVASFNKIRENKHLDNKMTFTVTRSVRKMRHRHVFETYKRL